MRELLLGALSQYGSPALFGVVMVAAIGLPLPVTLLLIVTGSLVSQGLMSFWPSILLAGAGSVIGDQIGYAVGRWAAPPWSKSTAVSAEVRPGCTTPKRKRARGA